MCFNFIARDRSRSTMEIKQTHTHISCYLVAVRAWHRLRVHECVKETGSKKVHICACAHSGQYMGACVGEHALLCVWMHSRVYVFQSWKKDRQPGLQDRRGWKGFSHMLGPDKAHLFGFGLPLPPSLHSGAASFFASGLSQLRWVSALQNAQWEQNWGHFFFILVVNRSKRPKFSEMDEPWAYQRLV